MTFDAGLKLDAGTDAGTPSVDAGVTFDASVPFDAGVPIFNACTEDKFIDRRGVSTTTVGFGGFGTSSSFTYSPACVVVSPGHEITFSGAFSSHPLSPGIFNNPSADTANNPITVTNAGMASTFTFNAVGEYPYFCQAHGSFGMAGVVRVRQ